ncbi:MAG: fimbria/pilus outer membrane usher protein, partial [Lysobacter sp.]
IGAFAQGNGSIVVMGGQAFASRRISDAFAVISTNGVGGVPILSENRLAGVTNDAGYLLLSDLRGWQRNRVAIDPDTLPADLALPAIERMVIPADRAGVRALFELQRLRSATLLLLDAQGQAVAVGTRVTRADGSVAIVGFDGALWLEQYLDGEVLRWQRAGATCSVITPVVSATPTATPLSPLTCRSKDTP